AWNDNAEFPDLISAIYYFPADRNAPASKFDANARQFAVIEPSPEIDAFREEAAKSDGRNFFEDRTALVIPRYPTLGLPNRIFMAVSSGVRTEPSQVPAGPKKASF